MMMLSKTWKQIGSAALRWLVFRRSKEKDMLGIVFARGRTLIMRCGVRFAIRTTEGALDAEKKLF